MGQTSVLQHCMTAVQHLLTGTAPACATSELDVCTYTLVLSHLRLIFSAFSIHRAMVWTMFLRLHVFVSVFPLSGISATVNLPFTPVKAIDMNVDYIYGFD